MDPIGNPYTPNAGSRPQELAGRDRGARAIPGTRRSPQARGDRAEHDHPGPARGGEDGAAECLRGSRRVRRVPQLLPRAHAGHPLGGRDRSRRREGAGPSEADGSRADGGARGLEQLGDHHADRPRRDSAWRWTLARPTKGRSRRISRSCSLRSERQQPGRTLGRHVPARRDAVRQRGRVSLADQRVASLDPEEHADQRCRRGAAADPEADRAAGHMRA